MKKKKTLYVTRVSNKILKNKWGFSPFLKGELYIRCNKNSEINWQHASIYTKEKLDVRESVVIIKNVLMN